MVQQQEIRAEKVARSSCRFATGTSKLSRLPDDRLWPIPKAQLPSEMHQTQTQIGIAGDRPCRGRNPNDVMLASPDRIPALNEQCVEAISGSRGGPSQA